MKKTLASQNSVTTVGATSRDFLVPSWSQLILYLLISLLLLIIFNLGRFWDYLNLVILAPGEGVDSLLAEHASSLHRIFSVASQSIILQVIFWIGIGSLVYILIWFIRNVVINILNDVVAASYIHPPSFNRFSYWESVIARKVFFGISLAVLMFYLFAGWRLVGSLADLAATEVSKFADLHSMLKLAGIVLIAMALIHSLILIGHITANSWRFIYRDL
jgi:hypothetical protein